MLKKVFTVFLALIMTICVSPTKVFAKENVSSVRNRMEIKQLPNIDLIEQKFSISYEGKEDIISYNGVSNEVKINDSTIIKPTWWPGNPNPQPGTEEYLFAQMQKNKDFNPRISPEVAKACAMEVSNNITKIAVGVIIKFVKSGNYSLASFLGHTGIGFFTGAAKVYYGCIAKYM